MSNRKWNKNEISYLVENYGRMSLEDMARQLNRSVMAVRLYALRHRLDDKHQVVKENRLKKLLEYRFRHLEDFHPSKFFFKETGINQVRYWDVIKSIKCVKLYSTFYISYTIRTNGLLYLTGHNECPLLTILLT